MMEIKYGECGEDFGDGEMINKIVVHGTCEKQSVGRGYLSLSHRYTPGRTFVFKTACLDTRGFTKEYRTILK